MYIQIKVKNETAGTLSELSAVLNGFPGSVASPPTPPTAFALDDGESTQRRIGTLAAGESASLYYFVNYPCALPPAAGSSISYTLTVADDTPNSVTSGTFALTTRSEISANAGGDVLSAVIGAGAVVGQILKVTIEYSFGNPNANADAMIQPVGNVSFDASRFRLVGADITASTFTGGPVTAADHLLYFPPGTVTGPSQNSMTVDYYFVALATGAASTIVPFADLRSGGQVKYTGNFGTCTNTPCDQSLPQPNDPFVITKTASATSLPSGGSVTYTVSVTNTSAFDTAIDSFADVLPAGVTYQGFGPGSDVTAANSSIVPAIGDSGTLSWHAQPGVPPPASSVPYFVPANSSIKLVYVAAIPATPGVYVNSATAGSHSLVVGPASETVFVGSTPTTEPTETATALPTGTPVPTDTPTAEATETSTPVPTDTHTPVPTDTATAVPTDTATPLPTDTATAAPTDTHTPIPTETATSVPTDTATPLPTETATALPTDTHTPIPTDTATSVPTDTATPTPTATATAMATDTHTPVPTATDTPVPTETSTAAPTPTVDPACGNGVLDAGEECDDGAANSDTATDACRTNCRLAGCGDGVEDTPIADFVFVIETSLSMSGDLRRIPTALGQFPELAAAAGVDYRLAVVRFGSGRLKSGAPGPDLWLDFTTDGDAFRSALGTLRSRMSGPTESGSEALDFTVDTVSPRPRAVQVLVLFTDEDDDLPVSIESGRLREPPRRKWLTSERTPLFQGRLDAVAQRIIDAGARAILVIRPKRRPSEFQYGAARMTRRNAQGRFDQAATLAALSAEQLDRSLQGQLLAGGRCDAGRCAEGARGYVCATDSDCGLYARVADIREARRRKTRDQFYRDLLDELVELARCQP
jgi:hypothetical protein